jgi:hypothetical protein
MLLPVIQLCFLSWWILFFNLFGHSYLVAYSIFCMRTTQILLVIEEQLWGPLMFSRKEQKRQFLWTSWTCAKRMILWSCVLRSASLLCILEQIRFFVRSNAWCVCVLLRFVIYSWHGWKAGFVGALRHTTASTGWYLWIFLHSCDRIDLFPDWQINSTSNVRVPFLKRFC